MEEYRRTGFSRALRRIPVLVLLIVVLIGSFGVQALVQNTNFVQMDFNAGATESAAAFWESTGDLQTLSSNNFSDGKFRAIVSAGTDGIASDPFVGMKIGGSYKLNYKVKAGDIIQVYFRYRDLAYDTEARPSNAQIFYAGAETVNADGKVAYQEKYSNSVVTDYSQTGYQLLCTEIDGDMVGKTLDYIRLDMINGGSQKFDVKNGAGWMLDFIYIGSVADAPHKKVTYKYRDPYDQVEKVEWVAKGSKPTKVPTPPTYCYNGSSTAASSRLKFSSWGGKSTATVKDTAINATTTYTASYITEYKVVYHQNKTSYQDDFAALDTYTSHEWVKADGYPTLANSFERTRRSSDQSLQYYLESWKVGDYFYSPEDALRIQIKGPTNFWGKWNKQARLRFYNASNSLIATNYVTITTRTTAPTAPAVSGKTFVAWVNKATSVPYDVDGHTVQGPADYTARYLSNAFVGSSTNSLVVNRTVTLQKGTNNASHKYRLRLDIYNYGQPFDGSFVITDNIKEDFFMKVNGPKVYTLNYLGNGQFEGDDVLEQKIAKGEAISSGGANGYVYELRQRENGSHTQWFDQNHPDEKGVDHNYFTMHVYDGYSNILGNTPTDVREALYCREISKAGVSHPNGCKLVVIVDFELDRDGTIGGNNVPLSHASQHSKVEIYGTDKKLKQTISLSSIHSKKGEAWPNVNIPILYDFTLHDYYMDLYDAQFEQYVYRGSLVKSTVTLPGIATVLRAASNGKHGDNNRKVYGNLFTHGNMPVYTRTESVPYTKLGLPNTDMNGVRNEKVRIFYKVVHNGTGQTVYETACEPYDTVFNITNQHEEIAVDFLKDHSATITATVVPSTGDVDSFGRGATTKWEKSGVAYYFAPRFAIADSNNHVAAFLQWEDQAYRNFVRMPSVEYGTLALPQFPRVKDLSANGKLTSKKDYICYSFSPADSYDVDQGRKIIDGIQVVHYTVEAINTPKRLEEGKTMETRNLVERHFYVLPASNITYDQHALTYTAPGNWLMSKESNSRISTAWQNFGAYPLQGYDKQLITERLSGTGTKTGNLLDYNGGSLYTNVDASQRNEWGEFTFTGTGFDMFTRCGPDTGVLVAQVYENGALVQNLLSDTYLAEKTLYQQLGIRFIAKDAQGNPKHGTYTVKFRAYYHEAFDHALYTKGGMRGVMTEDKIREIMGWDDSVACDIRLSNGVYPPVLREAKTGDYDVYVDGIRVYNTLGTLSSNPEGQLYQDNPNKENYAAYQLYGYYHEVNPQYINLNDYLVDSANGEWSAELGTQDASGVLYIVGQTNGDSYADAPDDDEAEDDSTQDDAIVHTGFHLGMSGKLHTKEVGDRSYLLDMESKFYCHKLSGHPIYYSYKNGENAYQTTVSNPLTVVQVQELLESRYFSQRYGMPHTNALYYFIRTPKGQQFVTENQLAGFVKVDSGKEFFLLEPVKLAQETAMEYYNITVQNSGNYVQLQDVGKVSYLVGQGGRQILHWRNACPLYQKENSDQVYYLLDQKEYSVGEQEVLYSYITAGAQLSFRSPTGEIHYYSKATEPPMMNVSYDETFLAPYIYYVDRGTALEFYYDRYTAVDYRRAYGVTERNQTIDCSAKTCGFTGCELSSLSMLYYADGVPLTKQTPYYPIGQKKTYPNGCALQVYYNEQTGLYTYGHDDMVIPDVELYAALEGKYTFYDSKYAAFGPAHEIYLSKGNGIAFYVGADAVVHLSARSADGNTVQMEVYDKQYPGWRAVTMAHPNDETEQYYDLTTYAKNNGGYLYIRNTGSGILSLMHLKLVGASTTFPKITRQMIMEAMEIMNAETPVLDEGLEIKHSLNLASDISLNYVVSAEAVVGAEKTYLTVDMPIYEGTELTATRTVTVEGEQRGNYYYYTLDGLTAVNMMDVLTARVYVEREGERYVSACDEYSIAMYAYGQLNKSNAGRELKTLCANLLRYGAQAQSYKGYRTDALADGEMTVAQQAYLTALDSVLFGNNNRIQEDQEAPTVQWVGKALDLNSKVAVKFIADLSGFVGSLEELNLRISYTDLTGQLREAVIWEFEIYDEEKNYIAFDFGELSAAELRSVLTARVCDGESPVSQSLIYSADTYGNNKTGKLLSLCKALFAYADSAGAYFSK